MKKMKGDKPIEDINMYMEISQGNSLCSYLYLKQTKMSFFFFFLLQNQSTREQNRSCQREEFQYEEGGRRERG
jgi:hypothetical protein